MEWNNRVISSILNAVRDNNLFFCHLELRLELLAWLLSEMANYNSRNSREMSPLIANAAKDIRKTRYSFDYAASRTKKKKKKLDSSSVLRAAFRSQRALRNPSPPGE